MLGIIRDNLPVPLAPLALPGSEASVLRAEIPGLLPGELPVELGNGAVHLRLAAGAKPLPQDSGDVREEQAA